jgi:hypothetical protein
MVELEGKPQLVSEALEAFGTRHKQSLRKWQKMPGKHAETPRNGLEFHKSPCIFTVFSDMKKAAALFAPG